jgi:transposase
LRRAEHGEWQLIGYDTTETLEFERPKLRVRVTKYPKSACPGHAECGVQQPPRPERMLVEGNRFGTSIAAEITTGKYAFISPSIASRTGSEAAAGCPTAPRC